MDFIAYSAQLKRVSLLTFIDNVDEERSRNGVYILYCRKTKVLMMRIPFKAWLYIGLVSGVSLKVDTGKPFQSSPTYTVNQH